MFHHWGFGCCNSIPCEHKPHYGTPITANPYSDNITIEGHSGTWYVIDVTNRYGKEIFLLEHEDYGDEAAHLAVDSNGTVLCEDIYDDWKEALEIKFDAVDDHWIEREVKVLLREVFLNSTAEYCSGTGICKDGFYLKLDNGQRFRIVVTEE